MLCVGGVATAEHGSCEAGVGGDGKCEGCKCLLSAFWGSTRGVAFAWLAGATCGRRRWCVCRGGRGGEVDEAIEPSAERSEGVGEPGLA